MATSPLCFTSFPRDPSKKPTKIKYQSDAFFYLHTINAFEDKDHIVVDIATYKNPHMLYCMYLDELATAQSNPDYATLFRGRPHRYVLPLNPDQTSSQNLVKLNYTSAKAKFIKDHIWLTPQMIADVGCETPTIHNKIQRPGIQVLLCHHQRRR